MEMKIIQCLECGADITITDRHQSRKTFCSRKCINAHQRKKTREIVCKECGKTVIQFVSKGLYCNDCFFERRRKREGLNFKVKRETRVCACCGKEFVPKVFNNVYCSKECQNEINKGTLKCSICDNKIKDDIFYHNITDFSPICAKCKDVYNSREKQRWDNYEAWHKANPGKGYSDYQTMRRKASGEVW